jgi:hypothetical protein
MNRIPITLINETVCGFTGLPLGRIFEKTRRREVIESRYLAMVFHKQLNDLTFKAVANDFGYPDHTQTIHALKYINNRVFTNKDFRHQYNILAKIFDKISDRKQVYISGPMTGLPDLNKSAFAEAEKIVNDLGFIAVNPHNLPLPKKDEYTWEDYMRNDIKYLMDCDIIVVLPGWEKSRGANIEVELCYSLKIPYYTLEDFKNHK